MMINCPKCKTKIKDQPIKGKDTRYCLYCDNQKLGYQDWQRIKFLNDNLPGLEKVLDITTRRNILQNLNPGNTYYCVDIDKDRLRSVKGIAKVTRKVDLEQDKIPFKDESFDTIIACEIIEHLKNPLNLLSEAKRLLKRGGLFIGTVPNWNNPRKKLQHLLGIWESDPFTEEHIRYFNKYWMKKGLEKYFDYVDVKHIGLLKGKLCFKATKWGVRYGVMEQSKKNKDYIRKMK
jgi:SAM-dependent methyltransferase